MALPGSVLQPAPGTLGVRLGAAWYAPVGPGMALNGVKYFCEWLSAVSEFSWKPRQRTAKSIGEA